MYKIVTTASFDKSMRKLPKHIVAKAYDAIEKLARDPYAPNNNVKKLVGREQCRLRIGDYRLFYEVRNEELILMAIDIKHRSEAYKL